MSLKTCHHSWLSIWLSCVLSALLPVSPLMLSLLPDDVRSEENDPTDANEEFEVVEASLSESNSVQRRSRRKQSGVRRALLPSQNACMSQLTRCTQRPSAGQVSLWGRCGPLHC